MKQLLLMMYAWTVVVLMLLQLTTGTYITYKKHDNDIKYKSNDIQPSKRYGTSFKSDRSIVKYLKSYGIPMMVWRCKNVIQPFWEWKPISKLELYCEAIGTLRSVSWYHNGKKISTQAEKHHTELIYPHFANGKYYSRWLDFKLKIHNATQSDSGVYTFRATSPNGYSEEQTIYVDISEKKKKKRNRKKQDKKSRTSKKSRKSKEQKSASSRPKGDKIKNKNKRKRLGKSKFKKFLKQPK